MLESWNERQEKKKKKYGGVDKWGDKYNDGLITQPSKHIKQFVACFPRK